MHAASQDIVALPQLADPNAASAAAAEAKHIFATLRPRPCKAEQAMLLFKLCTIYELLNPGALAGVHRANAANRSMGHAFASNLPATFTEYVAEKAELSIDDVKRGVRRGRSVDADLLELIKKDIPARGQGVFLDSLIDKSREEQLAAIAERQAARVATPTTPPEHPLFEAFCRRYATSNERVQAEDARLIMDFLATEMREGRL